MVAEAMVLPRVACEPAGGNNSNGNDEGTSAGVVQIENQAASDDEIS